MKKIFIMLITVFAMLTSTAYAVSPTYNQEDNSVSFDFGQQGFKTILITEKQTNDIFYIGQNSSEEMGLRRFLIKNKPKDGTYILKAGGSGALAANEEFSILTYYAVTANVNEHIDTVFLVDGADEYPGTIVDGTATFTVPKGTYTVKLTCEPGWHETAKASEVTVNEAGEVNLKITVAEDTYIISGTADEHITKVELKDGDNVTVGEGGTINETDYSFSITGVTAGSYTVVPTFAEGYELDTVKLSENDVADSKITVSGAVENLNITSKQTVYTVSGTAGKNAQKVKLMKNSSEAYSASVSNGAFEINGVISGEYTIDVEFEAESDYIIKSVSVGGETAIDNKITVEGNTANITIETEPRKYPVTATVDEHVDTITLTNIANEAEYYIGEKSGNTATFSVPKGTYSVDVTCVTGYQEILVSNVVIAIGGAYEPITVITEQLTEPVYVVTGTADTGVASVKLKNIESNKEITGKISTEEIDGKYTVAVNNVIAGTYQVIPSYKEHYGGAVEAIENITVSANMTEAFDIASRRKTYTVSGTVDAGVKSVTLKKGETELVGTISDTTVTFTDVLADIYDVEIEYNDEYEIIGTAPTTIAVTGTASDIFNIQTQVKSYTVSGTVDTGVKSVTLIKDGNVVKEGVIDGTTVTFADVAAGIYDIEIEYNDEYEIDGTEATTYEVTGSASNIFDIHTKAIHYTVTVNLGENVSSAVLLDGNDMPIIGVTDGATVTFSVPAGTYTVSATAMNGYDIAEYTPSSSVTVSKDNAMAETISVTAAEQAKEVYAISGTVDEGVASVVIKQGTTVVATITEFTDNQFSYNLPAGEYTVKVVPKEGYEIDGETDTTNFEVVNEAVEVTVAKTKPEEVSIEPETETDITEGKDSEDNDTIVLTTKIKNVADGKEIIAVAYKENGTLVSVKMSKINGNEISFEFKKDIDIKTFKILVWNSIEDMEPVTKGEKKEYN